MLTNITILCIVDRHMHDHFFHFLSFSWWHCQRVKLTYPSGVNTGSKKNYIDTKHKCHTVPAGNLQKYLSVYNTDLTPLSMTRAPVRVRVGPAFCIFVLHLPE